MEIKMDTKDLFDQGLETRKAVLGEDYVNNSINNADEFGMKLQAFSAPNSPPCMGSYKFLQFHA